jgi:hypothetical protein
VLPEGWQDHDLGSGEHDTDAIYVPQVTASVTAEATSQIVSSPSQVNALLPEAVCGEAGPGSVWRIWHPPDKVSDGSHLYLTIRQLRI